MNVWFLLLVFVVGFGCTESSSDGSSSCEVTGSCSAMGDAMLPMTELTDAGHMSDESEVIGSDTTVDEEVESASDEPGGADDEDPNVAADSRQRSATIGVLARTSLWWRAPLFR